MTTKTFIYDPVLKKMVPKGAKRDNGCRLYIHADVEPFQSVVDGTVVTGRTALREHNKRNDVTQVDKGVEQDWARNQKARDNFYNTKEAKEDRLGSIKESIERLGG